MEVQHPSESSLLIAYEDVLLPFAMDYSEIGHASVATLLFLEAHRRRHNSELVCCDRFVDLPAECGEYRIDGAILTWEQ